jgi:esterase/lipase
MKDVYILSGLGADERVFQLLDFSSFNPIFIKWISPIEQETIESYSTRLLEQIKAKKPTIIGLSFGGIIAIEIAKQIKTEKIILLASVKTKNEVPFYYRLAGLIGLHKLLPTKLLKKQNFITNWFFGATSIKDKKLLKQILSDTDVNFLKWAIDKIVCWANQTKVENVYHIHGSKDRILPKSFVKCNLLVTNGGHLMTLNKTKEIDTALLGQI